MSKSAATWVMRPRSCGVGLLDCHADVLEERSA